MAWRSLMHSYSPPKRRTEDREKEEIFLTRLFRERAITGVGENCFCRFSILFHWFLSICGVSTNYFWVSEIFKLNSCLLTVLNLEKTRKKLKKR